MNWLLTVIIWLVILAVSYSAVRWIFKTVGVLGVATTLFVSSVVYFVILMKYYLSRGDTNA